MIFLTILMSLAMGDRPANPACVPIEFAVVVEFDRFELSPESREVVSGAATAAKQSDAEVLITARGPRGSAYASVVAAALRDEGVLENRVSTTVQSAMSAPPGTGVGEPSDRRVTISLTCPAAPRG